MSCCVPTIVTFHNVSEKNFGYDAGMRLRHGSTPKVEVWYVNAETDELYLSTNQNNVTLTGNPVNHISVDHGGPASGIIKVT